ncbi:hypothetical protein M2271_008102 [Streptomyces sp. LBL]|nr:hypothetical protein [Streptomyces sp. LBL]
MDLRFYHDGMGQDTYAEQLEGLNITYEDYEPEFGTPYGIARTSELLFWANESTPSADRLAEQVEAVRVLPQLAAPPKQLIKAKVFGPGLYSEPDRSTPAKAKIEDETFLVLDPQRKVRPDPEYTPAPHALSIGFGTDWSGLVSAWLTEWERKGPQWEKVEARVRSTMETIAAQPNGFVQGSGLYDLDTGRFAVSDKPVVSVSHLSAVFGLNELCAELIDLVDLPKFNEAYFDYCRYRDSFAVHRPSGRW